MEPSLRPLPSLPALPGLPALPRVTGLRHRARDLTVRLTRDVRALATPAGVCGAVIETAWVAAHFAMYPLGLLRERPQSVERYNYQHLTLRQRSLVISRTEAA